MGSPWLQWGRGSSAAEGTYDKAALLEAIRASMGPRLFSRGRETSVCRSYRPSTASMGPRLFSRGRAARYGRVSGRGRCFNGAAALQPRKVHPPLQTSCLVSQLQWGRGSSAAEGFLAGVADVLQVGFNGAAALQPRKARSSTSVADPLRASMGPRLFSRGRSIFITRSRARGQTIVREHPAGNARSASQHDLQQCHKSFLRQEL